jgi:hypothetical protein
LSARDVHDVVIGGVAAIVHGVPRTTFVVDLLIDATPPSAPAPGGVCVLAGALRAFSLRCKRLGDGPSNGP